MYVCEDILDGLSKTWTQGHRCELILKQCICLHDKVNTTHPIITRLYGYISLVMCITRVNFGRIRWYTFFHITDVFCKVNQSIGHIVWIVCPIEVNQKWSTWIGYWVNYITLTFDLTHDSNLDYFKAAFFLIAPFQELSVWLMWNEKEANQLDTAWANYATFSF